METSRRKFIKQVGLGSLVAFNLPEIISSADKEKSGAEKFDSQKLVFLFQGDSITDGGRSTDNDWNHIMGQSFPYLIASRLWYDYRDKNLMFYNRGISGNRVKDLDARWQLDTIDIDPDVLTILIGVNDVIAMVEDWNPDSVEQFEESFRRIMDKTKEMLPDTLIVLCEPFILPLGWVNKKPEVWMTEINKRQDIVKKMSVTYNTLFLELQKPFNDACKNLPASYWIWDGVHPMPAGHELIARLWINEVRKKINFIK
jgi:lysophospholipase L1-like esterase